MWFAESEDAKITQIVESLSCIEPTAPNLVRFCLGFIILNGLSIEYFEIKPGVSLTMDVYFRLLSTVASSLYKALGQGTLQMEKCTYTIAHRKLGSGSAYTRKFILICLSSLVNRFT